MKAYLDTNAVEYLAAEMSLAELTTALSRAGYELSLGMHVVYELARSFLSRSVTRTVFQVLAELEDVHYVPPVHDLILAEVLQLRLGGRVLHHLSPLNRVATRLELQRLARGRDRDARAFIAGRETDVAVGHRRIAEANRRLADQYFRTHPGARSRVRTFGRFRIALRPIWADMLRQLLGRLVQPGLYSRVFLQRVFLQADDFPVLNTWLNCQLHLAFIVGVERQRPDQHRLDDYRHAIESNAADLFVTNDTQLLRAFPTLNPFRRVMPWTEFRAKLQ